MPSYTQGTARPGAFPTSLVLAGSVRSASPRRPGPGDWTGIVLLAVVLCACSSKRGFDRGALSHRLAEELPQVTDEAIQAAYELRPQLPQSYRLGVFFNEPKHQKNSYWHEEAPQYWLGEDKDEILGMGNELRDKGIVSDIFVVVPIEGGTDLHSIRLAAARQGADAVLVVNGISDVEEHNNAWTTSYILLVTALFVPGNELDALFMASASLWDVRNEFLYLTAESEATSHQTRAPVYIEEERAIAAARKEALKGLREELTTRLQRTAGLSEGS